MFCQQLLALDLSVKLLSWKIHVVSCLTIKCSASRWERELRDRCSSGGPCFAATRKIAVGKPEEHQHFPAVDAVDVRLRYLSTGKSQLRILPQEDRECYGDRIQRRPHFFPYPFHSMIFQERIFIIRKFPVKPAVKGTRQGGTSWTGS
jgi:hypothetical protein